MMGVKSCCVVVMRRMSRTFDALTSNISPHHTFRIRRMFLQVIDTGLDETSCFFVDEDGEEIAHGHYFEELGFANGSDVYAPFTGGDFSYDLNRRKVMRNYAPCITWA